MKKCDEASSSIILAGQALLVKMLITFEPDGIFGILFFSFLSFFVFYYYFYYFLSFHNFFILFSYLFI